MINIRVEKESDVTDVEALLEASFGGSEEMEIVGRLRESRSWLGDLALVAIEHTDAVVGYCVASRAFIGTRAALALGPIGVSPPRQANGIGTMLMNRMIELAREAKEPLIGLLGEPGYYSRFGFVAGHRVGVTPQVAEWGDYFQVLALVDDHPTGTFEYPDAFRTR